MNSKRLLIIGMLIVMATSLIATIQVGYTSDDINENDILYDNFEIPPSTSVGPAAQGSNATDFETTYEYGPVEYVPIYVWAVADEEFRSQSYPTTWFQSVSWQDYIDSVIVRGNYLLQDTFGIDLNIVDSGQWCSTNGLVAIDLFKELLRETSFKSEETCLDGYRIDILIALTGQEIIVSGEKCAAAAIYKKRVILMKYNAYWADDNVLRHEVSHIFGAKDHIDESDPHYFDDCIMSYRMVHVEFWVEDGWVWYVGKKVCEAGISQNWCEDCKYNIRLHRSPWYFHKNPDSYWKWVPK